MNWLAILIVAVLGLLVGGAASGLLANRRPDWPPRRRTLTAAAIAPALILLATGVGIAASGGFSGSGDVHDVYPAVLLTVGGVGALVAFVSGLASAWLVSLDG